MEAGDILKLFLIAGGALLLLISITSLARKRLNESFALFWGVMSLIFIITGLSIQPVLLSVYLSSVSLVLIILAIVCITWAFFFLSIRASELARKNTELAINVSLLQQEVEMLQKRIDFTEETLSVEPEKMGAGE